MSLSTPESNPIDGDPRGLRLLEQGNHRPAVERRQRDRIGMPAQSGLEHVDLPVDLRFALRPFKGDVDAKVPGRLLRPELHGLPELVLKPLEISGMYSRSAALRTAQRARSTSGDEEIISTLSTNRYSRTSTSVRITP